MKFAMFFYSSPECHLFRPISQRLNPPKEPIRSQFELCGGGRAQQRLRPSVVSVLMGGARDVYNV